ncbi:ankyrin repeat domain-containing protein 53 [Boleophthalmus pectinirostris]|uniref:ankyrin repeat domain-containing protein 53 n=1 Tax=Boleophthalmus pectinirostris TaxID=150288 RepID=UPI00242BC02D|nr:ankyrin repeat domain-containing protein 53 [Boleophthalmus pectinirostris]
MGFVFALLLNQDNLMLSDLDRGTARNSHLTKVMVSLCITFRCRATVSASALENSLLEQNGVKQRSLFSTLTVISMATKAPDNKSGKQGRGKSKSLCHTAPKSARAPPADDVRRDSESAEDFLERIVRTLKVDVQGLSPLHVACLRGQLGSLQHMLESGEWWINSSDDSQGRRPLHMFLCIRCTPQTQACFRYLLQQGADVNLTTASGQTPLHMAVAEGQMEYTRMLVEAGADLFARDHSGLLPLDMARMWNRRKIGRYLKDCMWHEQNNKELEARVQTQTIYCDLMDCDKRDKISKKPKIDKTVTEWANKKGLTLRKEFCPKVLVSQFHKKCLISDNNKEHSRKEKKTERESSLQSEEGAQEDKSTSPSSSVGQEEEINHAFKLPKLKPWAIYTGPEPDSPMVEPALRGKVNVWRDASSTKPHYKSKWDRRPHEAPSLPVDTIQRVFFPRDFPHRIQKLGDFQTKDIEGVPHRACPQGRTTSAWTDVAMHLQENLEPGHY